MLRITTTLLDNAEYILSFITPKLVSCLCFKCDHGFPCNVGHNHPLSVFFGSPSASDVFSCPCCFVGVAEGVGGWRDYGVDPSLFSGTLMRTCERLAKEGHFLPSNPVGILTTSYYELLQNKVPLLGKCYLTTNLSSLFYSYCSFFFL